jgi:protein-S-isoprenylcysteine O-methyltransferase Ste14
MFHLYQLSIILIFGFAAVVFILLFFVSAPYGKFQRKGWGPSIKTKWAWMSMEFPSTALMVWLFISTPHKTLPHFIFIACWLANYIDRTFIYPFTQSGREKPYPFLLVGMAFVFNCMNSFINGYGVFHLVSYSSDWTGTLQFKIGIVVFLTGFVVNKISDTKLRRLRNSNPEEYVVPQGFIFRFISSPHYFGEIMEWVGWAVMTWSLPGLAFAVFTFANLFPRAWASHRWYRENFPDYPKNRKAIVPFII